MKKILIMAALALLTAGSFLSAAVAAPRTGSSVLPPIHDIPPPPPGCQGAILVISPDPEIGVYWKCLPGH